MKYKKAEESWNIAEIASKFVAGHVMRGHDESHKTIRFNVQRAQQRCRRRQIVNSKWDKAMSINGISLKIGRRPTLLTPSRSTRLLQVFSLAILLSCMRASFISVARSLSLPPSLSLSLSLFLSLSVFPDNEFVAAPRSPPVKSYLVTARNMLGEAYLSVRLHLSVPVPFPRTRRREESAGSRRDDWKYTVTRCCSSPVVVIVVGFRNPSSRHRGIAPPGMALAPVAPSPTTTSGNNRRAQTDYPRDARVARCVGAHSLGITVMTKKNRGSYFSLVLRRVFLVESQGKTADRRVTIIFTFSLRLKYRLFAFDTVLIISFGYNSM